MDTAIPSKNDAALGAGIAAALYLAVACLIWAAWTFAPLLLAIAVIGLVFLRPVLGLGLIIVLAL